MKIVYNISFIIIIAFALVGMFVLAIGLHELSHMQDYSKLKKQGFIENDKLCLLCLDKETAGYYKFNYPIEAEEEVKRIRKYTEIRAYSVTAIVMLLFFMCLAFVVFKYYFEVKNGTNNAG